MAAVARRRPVEEQPALFEAHAIAHTEAREAEFVPTPGWVVRAIIEGVHEPLPLEGPCAEPALGRGDLLRAVNAVQPSTSRRWYVGDLRGSSIAWASNLATMAELGIEIVGVGDFLAGALVYPARTTSITNPPWSLAASFYERMCKLAAGVGTVVLHVPLPFTAEEVLERYAADVYPIEGRPYPFARETCAVVHGPGRGGRWRRLRRPR